MTESERNRILEDIRNLQSMIDNCYDKNNPDLRRWKAEIKNLKIMLKRK